MTDYAPGIRLSVCSKLAVNKKKKRQQFLTSSNFFDFFLFYFDIFLFYVIGSVTGLSFMTLSLQFLDYDNFLFHRFDQKYGNQKYSSR